MPQLRALHHPLWSLPTQKHSIDRDGISNVVILISGIVIVWPSKRRETMSYTPYHNTLTGVEMFPSSTLDAMPSAYSRHPLLLSLFTGAMETKKYACFSRWTASVQPLVEEDKANGGESEKNASGFMFISLPSFDLVGTAYTMGINTVVNWIVMDNKNMTRQYVYTFSWYCKQEGGKLTAHEGVRALRKLCRLE